MVDQLNLKASLCLVFSTPRVQQVIAKITGHYTPIEMTEAEKNLHDRAVTGLAAIVLYKMKNWPFQYVSDEQTKFFFSAYTEMFKLPMATRAGFAEMATAMMAAHTKVLAKEEELAATSSKLRSM